MTKFSLVPGFLKIRYSVGTRTHALTVPVLPVSVYSPGFLTPELEDKTGNPVALTDAVNAICNALKGAFGDTCSFIESEFWQQETITSDPTWIQGGIINGISGTQTNPATSMLQAVLTFRSSMGGIGKVYLMETPHDPNLRFSGSAVASSDFSALRTYLLGDTCVWRARDNGFPVTVIRVTTKTNDALRKRYLL